MVVAQEEIQYQQSAHEAAKSHKVVKRKVRTSNSMRRAKTLAVSLVIVGFVAGSAVAAEYARLAIKNYDISQLQQSIQTEQTQNEQLQLQISQLKSIGRIEMIATQQLGMVKPAQNAFLNYQVAPQAQTAKTGVVTPEQSSVDVQPTQGNPVIQQVAKIFSGIFGTKQK